MSERSDLPAAATSRTSLPALLVLAIALRPEAHAAAWKPIAENETTAADLVSSMSSGGALQSFGLLFLVLAGLLIGFQWMGSRS